ncbi:unnamed protein product [Merluccius merluccius]
MKGTDVQAVLPGTGDHLAAVRRPPPPGGQDVGMENRNVPPDPHETRVADANAPVVRGDADALLSRISSWVDTQYSVRKALEHMALGHGAAAARDTFLSRRANRRFLELHRDIGEECGPGDRQHSWAAIEKPDEVLMYGPYYPNYASGEHSEDLVVRQTEELLGAELRARRQVRGGFVVYIFTQNSPCLDRDTQPCMLHLVEKALEWHALYGAKTHIGYAKCWGFKGNKEMLFRDIDRKQLERVGLSHDHESYVDAVRNCPEGNLRPLSKDLFSAVRQILEEKNLRFSLMRATQEQNWKSSFKCATCVSECEPRGESDAPPTRELDAMAEAAQELVSDGTAQSLEGHVESGRAFSREYGFDPQTRETARAEARLAFGRCWRDMVEGRYAEVIRERLTDDFNRRVTHLFSEDVVKFDKEYIQYPLQGYSCTAQRNSLGE